MGLIFEWDPAQAKANRPKHRVSFEEAATVLADPLTLTIPDPLHSGTEQRFVTMGTSYRRRMLVVVHVDRGDRIRIISARKATRRERQVYEESE